MPTTITRTARQTSVPVNVNMAAAALAIVPTTANELLLLAALRESQSQNIRTEVHTFELQASNILNEAYADRLCAKLAAQNMGDVALVVVVVSMGGVGRRRCCRRGVAPQRRCW